MTLETSFEVGGETTTYNIYNGVPTKICGNYFTLNSIVTTHIKAITLDYACTTESLGHTLTHRNETSTMIEHDYCEVCTKHFVDGEIIDTMLEFSLAPKVGYNRFTNVTQSTLLGHYATEFTIPANTLKGTYDSFTPDNNFDKANDRLLLLGNTPQAIVFFAENTGTEDITISIAPDSYGPKDVSAPFTIPAGRTVRYDYFDNSNISTPGPWVDIVVQQDVTVDTTLKLFGYVDTCDTFASKQLTTSALPTTTKFKVGETFNHDGLVLRIDGSDSAKVVNYTTNFDGHTFAHEDVGTQTVEINFGIARYTYEILVWEEHSCADNLVYVPASEPTPFANGSLDYYRCTQDGNIFEDAAATIPTTIEARSKTSKQWVLVTPAKNNGNWWIKDSVVTLDEDPVFNAGPVAALRFNFGKDNDEQATAGFEWKFVRVSDGEINAPYFNPHLPSKQGATISVKWVIVNKGTTDVDLYLKLDEWQAESQINVTAAAGQTNIIEHSYVDSTATDGWMYGRLNCTINKNTDFYMYGYVSMDEASPIDGTTNTLTKLADAEKLTFKVGETFSYNGLTAKTTLSGNSSGSTKPYIHKFTTNFDGHVFTASDIGEHTVVARFGGDTITYTINVTA